MSNQTQRRVLIVVQNLPVPFDRRVWLEATTLTRNGYRVSIICPKAKGFNQSREMLEDIDIYRYTLPIDAQGKLGFIAEFIWCFLATALLTLRVALTGRGFDILHVCNPPETYWPLGWFWRAFGKVFIFDHHDLSPEMAAAKFGRDGGLLIKGLMLFEKLTFQAAQVVITTNDSHRRIAETRGAKAPEDVFVVRSGPDLSRFSHVQPNPQWFQGKPHLLAYLGEICQQDGVDYLIRALKILRGELGRTDFHCVLMGGGPHQAAIKAYAAEIGAADLCTFTGRISDQGLCEVLSSAHVAIDPDPKNPWSDQSTMNKIMEYMWFGVPIVAFDLAEARVSAGEAAVFVTANDEGEMARAIARLLDDSGERARLGEIGRRRIRDALAWEYSIPPLLAAYERAWNKRRRKV